MKNKIPKGIIWVIWLAIVVAAAFCVSQYCVQLMLIQGDSMLPSYHNMQLVLVDKQSESYQRGDVVAFRCEGLEEKRIVLVKRIVAVPGDVVQITEGTLFVNGEFSEQFPQKGMFDDPGIAAELIRLGENEYFVLGDNVAKSKDSRHAQIGVVPEEAFIGKILS